MPRINASSLCWPSFKSSANREKTSFQRFLTSRYCVFTSSHVEAESKRNFYFKLHRVCLKLKKENTTAIWLPKMVRWQNELHCLFKMACRQANYMSYLIPRDQDVTSDLYDNNSAKGFRNTQDKQLKFILPNVDVGTPTNDFNILDVDSMLALWICTPTTQLHISACIR